MAFGIHHGATRICNGQHHRITPTVSVVLGAAIDSEMGSLVDKRPGSGIGTGLQEPIEDFANVDGSKLIVPWSRYFSVSDLHQDGKIYART